MTHSAHHTFLRPRPVGALATTALVLWTGLWASSAPPCRAQTLPEDVRYTFALVGVALSEALERLIDETDISLVYASDLVAGRTAFCRAERVRAEALLACTLRDTGLDFVRLSSGTYVLVRDPREAPRSASLFGQVVDAETGVPLSGASVVLAADGSGTATNRDGRFAFPALRSGPYRVVVSHVAYHDAADTVFVGPEEHERISVPLSPRVVLTSPVVVSGFRGAAPSAAFGTARRAGLDLDPLAGPGSGDVVQSLDAVAGVRLGDALSDVHVQGGASDEQQFLLDGVPVFMPVSNGGFISPFSPFAVGQVTVRKAGFGASHGSGLSGVIEVEHRLTASGKRDFTAQVDPLGLNARWRGRAGSPGGAAATWLVAVRRSLWGWYRPAPLVALFRRWASPDALLYEALGRQEAHGRADGLPVAMPEGPLEVGFDDVHAAVRVRFGGLRSLYASVYRGRGAFGVDDAAMPRALAGRVSGDLFEDAYRWRNRTVQVRHEWVQSRRLFLAAGVFATSYALLHPAGTDDGAAPTPRLAEANGLTETGVRASADLAASAGHYLSGAVEAVHAGSDFRLSLDPFGARPAGPDGIRPVQWRLAAFVEDRFSVGRHTTLTLGSRLTYLPAMRHVFSEPRLAIQFDQETERRGVWAARVAAGRYRQYVHAFDVATYNVTSLVPRMRFWLPVGAEERPPDVYHATVALLYRPGPPWQVSVETYYKHQPHLLVLDYGERAAAVASGDVLRSADGNAYGAAFTVSYFRERLRAEAQYEHAVARRRVPGRFGGALVPVPWDAPHRLHARLDVRPWAGWTATVRWQGVFGRSWGFRQGYYDLLAPDPATRVFPPFDLSDPGAHRLPAFLQLDLSLAYGRDVFGARVQARLGVLNALGRDNVTSWSLHPDGAGTYARTIRQATPQLPTFSLRLSR